MSRSLSKLGERHVRIRIRYLESVLNREFCKRTGCPMQWQGPKGGSLFIHQLVCHVQLTQESNGFKLQTMYDERPIFSQNKPRSCKCWFSRSVMSSPHHPRHRLSTPANNLSLYSGSRKIGSLCHIAEVPPPISGANNLSLQSLPNSVPIYLWILKTLSLSFSSSFYFCLHTELTYEDNFNNMQKWKINLSGRKELQNNDTIFKSLFVADKR